MTTRPSEVIELRSWHQVREAFRAKELRQAGYSEGAVITAGTLLDLHGPEHRDRRRIENRLFRREVFAYWEHEVLGSTVRATLDPFIAAGEGDLAQIGYRAAISLTATIAGIDHDPADIEATERLYEIVKKFSEGATLMHSTRDHDEVRTEVRAAMERFESQIYGPAFERRRRLIAEAEAGNRATDDLPKDVLTTLLSNRTSLELADQTLMREIAFYLQAGAHSTANAFTHTVDDLLVWGAADPAALRRARDDVGLVQRGMHESLRLHPASPFAYRRPLATVELSDGTVLSEGSLVVLDLTSANRDPSVFGSTADTYDPMRVVPADVPRWGLSFGGGTHACIGAELDGGLEIEAGRGGHGPGHLYGTVAVIAHAFLAAGGRGDPDRPPALDPASTRAHFDSYPVVFPPGDTD